MNSLKLKVLLLAVLIGTVSMAQQKMDKLSKTIKVNSDVTIDLDISHVEIEISTWDKNSMEVEAYLESDKLSKEDLQKALDNWKIDIDGSGDFVSITSRGVYGSWDYRDMVDTESAKALAELELQLADLPEIPEMPEMPEVPEIPEMDMLMNMPQLPKLPDLPELPEGMHNVNFDYDQYKKEGEKYLERWSKEYEEKYGKDYKDQMRTWAKEFGKIDWKAYEKEMEAWGERFGEQFGEEFGKKFEKWGEEFGEKFSKDYERRMEEWGERFGAQMERKAEMLARRAEQHAERNEKMAVRLEKRQEEMAKRQSDLARSLEKNSKAIKTIKIKMPKKAKLKMNVRHGELKFSSVINNLKAEISHATLVADNIDGSETSINVSYSPVYINTWAMGELFLNFVDKAHIKNVDRLSLSSNSSNIHVDNLRGSSIINGSFGDLNIGSIANSFKNLNIVLENSEAIISLPEAPYNLQYKGNRSKLNHPESKDVRTSNFSTGSLASDKTIIVNSKFSNIIMQ